MIIKKIATFAIAGLLATATAAHADNFTFTTAGVGTVTGSTGAGVINLQITSLDNVNISDAQALAGVLLTLSNSAGTTSLTSALGDLITLSNDGTFVDNGTGSLTHWGASSSGTTLCVATVNGNGSTCAAGHQPYDLLLGSTDLDGTYNVTGNITNFNPYVKGTATFVIAATGVTADTSVTAATFGTSTSFVTDPGTPTNPTPEPSSLIMLGTGIVGAAGMLRRRFAL